MFEKVVRKILLVIVDVIAINAIALLVFLIHFEGNIPSHVMVVYLQCVVILTIGKLLIYKVMGLYNSLWEYASIEELIKVVGAVVGAGIIGTIYMITSGMDMFYGTYLLIIALEVIAIGSIRFSYRIIRRVKQRSSLTHQVDTKNVLIIGSGATASVIATEIKNHSDVYGTVVGYIDNDEKRIGKHIAGIKVLGNCNDVYSVSKRARVDEIIVAMPTISNRAMKELLAECKRTDAKVRIMPGVREMIDGQVSMKKIRDVEIEDLLGRDPIDLDVAEVAGYIEDKVIMVTGGGGSIGSELCRQIVKFEPGKLIILDIYENNAYEIQNELKRAFKDELDLDVIIASVRDRDNIFSIIKEHRPNVIFHAAAHKHVPLMERSPREAIKNNVFGTMNVAEAADAFGVERFVMISTDKAVNPTNIMGASKRMCEMVIQGIAKKSKTNFMAVRFGNVLGSNGSVIPIFKKQIKEGGPVTVTHKEIIRYFMTIPEAAQLVIQASAIAKGGEIFVLDMGEPVKIYNLAKDLIELSGFKVGKDIDIEITGLRPGEKLYEELLMDDEELKSTKYKKIYIGKLSEFEYSVLKQTYKQLWNLVTKGSLEEVLDMVHSIVPTYRDYKEVNNENKHKMESNKRYYDRKISSDE